CGFRDVSMVACDLAMFQLWPVFCSSSGVALLHFLSMWVFLVFVCARGFDYGCWCGQANLLKSSILVVGAGGLGAPALLYFAAAGVGKIRVFF
ncbi:adenylyltransferase and sulfurtransferase MOCS3-like, partial [Trifolium medium]|nr:adenylyltransferase and sulfurtransferase MOCS3-like [Trifolium medium]